MTQHENDCSKKTYVNAEQKSSDICFDVARVWRVASAVNTQFIFYRNTICSKHRIQLRASYWS